MNLRPNGTLPAILLLLSFLFVGLSQASQPPGELQPSSLPVGAGPTVPLEGGSEIPEPAILQLSVFLVDEELTLRPVPKWAFLITRLDDPKDTQTVVTSSQGEVRLELPSAEYAIRSSSPVSFHGASYSWETIFRLDPGVEFTLELSIDNANITQAEETAPVRATMSPGDLYAKYRAGVFKIEAEGSTGSGFLVSHDGLIVTNHHVVRDSNYLAVKVNEYSKYPATLLAFDAGKDVAVIRVNPQAVAEAPVLPLAEDAPGAPTVSVGQTVVAIGSPLGTEALLTAGLVSKIEKEAIYSDVSINPGNSGGPLMSMNGEVVGINTFGIRTPTVGPGVSGIVRIYLAGKVLDEARSSAHASPIPSAGNLPIESAYRFPAKQLSEMALTEEFDPSQYHLEVGKIDVQFVTPVNIAVTQVRAEKATAQGRKKRTKGKEGAKDYKPGKDFFEWRQYVGDYRPLVVTQAIPEIKLTGGSKAGMIFGALLGVVVPGRYEFKTRYNQKLCMKI